MSEDMVLYKIKNEYAEILKIKPGITDYAAIAFRNEEKILRSNALRLLSLKGAK